MKLAPSLLAADFGALREEARSVEPHADLFHWDVMDGHFVPNLTFGPPVVNALKRSLRRPFDIHLMIERPAVYAPQFLVDPQDTIVFHVEAADSPERSIAAIRSTGAAAGISLRPGTPLNRVRPHLDDVTMVLVMSVEPGFGGQLFHAEAVERIARLRSMIGDRPVAIAVDGGIGPQNVSHVVAAGADVIIAGSSIFGAPDRVAAMRALREAAQ